MPDNITAKEVSRPFLTHEETSAVSLAPDSVLKPGSISLQGNVLTVQNKDLASLIETKLASAARLAGGRAAASDADVSVGIKVHF